MNNESCNQQRSSNYLLSKALVPLKTFQKDIKPRNISEDAFRGIFGYGRHSLIEENRSNKNLNCCLLKEFQELSGYKASIHCVMDNGATEVDRNDEDDSSKAGNRLSIMFDLFTTQNTVSILLRCSRLWNHQIESCSKELVLRMAPKGETEIGWNKYKCLSYKSVSILIDSESGVKTKSTTLMQISNDSSRETIVKKPIPVTRRKSSKPKKPCELSPLRSSLFPNVSPYLVFTTFPDRMRRLPKQTRKVLQWQVFDITPTVIQTIIKNSGLNTTRHERAWFATWEKHLKRQVFKRFKEWQKINHFPGTSHIGHKDKLWLNIVRMQGINGKHKFSFMPETFILPQNMKSLREAWFETGRKASWIIKPPTSSRGEGIKIVHRWSDIPKRGHVIVQRYISQPFLINDTKFDLRLYVLVTSFDPLRLYVYEDGLVRFASEKYSTCFGHLSKPFVHLTNYSINCNNLHYTTNEDENLPQGHKWSLKCLWSYFRENGIDDRKVWTSLVDVVLKTFISCEDPLDQLAKKYAKNKYSCYELFGFDVMLDYCLKPWLLEVNISPSLHTDSQLDLKIKGELLTDMFNLVGFQIPEVQLTPKTVQKVYGRTGIDSQSPISWNKNLYTFNLTRDDRIKQIKHKNGITNSLSILKYLTPGDVRQLVQSEDELARCGRFVRIFPSKISSPYLALMEDIKYYNLLLHAWEKKFHGRRQMGIVILQSFCQQGLHLQIADTVENLNQINMTAMQESFLRVQHLCISLYHQTETIVEKNDHSSSLPAIKNKRKKSSDREVQRAVCPLA